MQASDRESRKRRLPRLGMRLIKTGICVFICLTLNYLFSPRVALISSIASIVCLQSSLEATKRTSVNQFLGTAIGGGAGMALIPLAETAKIDWLYLLIVPCGLILIIYVCIMLNMRGETTICAFVYVTVLIVPFDPARDSNPYVLAGLQTADTAVGVLVAMIVNRYVVPPKASAPADVHIRSTYLDELTERVRCKLTGLEELVVIETALLEAKPEPLHTPKRGELLVPGTVSVRLPVPTELSRQKYLNGVYITQDLNVIPFYLLQRGGYADVPCTARNVSICWHVPAPVKETYGWLHPKQIFTLGKMPHPPRLLIQKYKGAKRGPDESQEDESADEDRR